MKKLKKLWPLFFSLIILLFLIIISTSRPKIILFYGSTCPHCEKVDEYLKTNPSKTRYRHLEVYGSQKNANLMGSKARLCGLDSEKIGVPFLYAGENCLIGDEEIINWFKQK